jgi:hypothetical protein
VWETCSKAHRESYSCSDFSRRRRCHTHVIAETTHRERTKMCETNVVRRHESLFVRTRRAVIASDAVRCRRRGVTDLAMAYKVSCSPRRLSSTTIFSAHNTFTNRSRCVSQRSQHSCSLLRLSPHHSSTKPRTPLRSAPSLVQQARSMPAAASRPSSLATSTPATASKTTAGPIQPIISCVSLNFWYESFVLTAAKRLLHSIRTVTS